MQLNEGKWDDTAERLKSLARSRGLSVNKLVEEMNTRQVPLLGNFDLVREKQKATVSRGFLLDTGGSAEIRTRDQRIKSPLLYRLSYRPVDST